MAYIEERVGSEEIDKEQEGVSQKIVLGRDLLYGNIWGQSQWARARARRVSGRKILALVSRRKDLPRHELCGLRDKQRCHHLHNLCKSCFTRLARER